MKPKECELFCFNTSNGSINIVEQVASRWKFIACLLDFEDSIVSNIEANNPRKVENCCLELFKKWLQRSESETWEKLLEALKGARYGALEEQLRRVLIERGKARLA